MYTQLAEAPSTVPKLGELPAYLPWLDALRFLACLLVIVLHAIPNAPAGIGHAGVALFFSLSGFLIGRGLVVGQTLSMFYARRFLRIYPAYITTLALFAVLSLTPLLHGQGSGNLFWHNISYYATFTIQLSPDLSKLPLIIVWTLCVEELFYLFVPLVFLLRKPAIIATVLASAVAILLVPRFAVLPNGAGTWFLFPINLFFGVLLALAKPLSKTYPPLLAVVSICILVINAFTGWFHYFGPVSALLCTATVWSLAIYRGSVPRIAQPLIWMGELSYGIYLLHFFILSMVVRLLSGLRGHPPAFYSAAVLLTLTGSSFLAWAMRFIIEEPALKLRTVLKARPRLRCCLAAIQISFIPVGILLALVHWSF